MALLDFHYAEPKHTVKVLIVQTNSSFSSQFGPLLKEDGFDVSVHDAGKPIQDSIRQGVNPDLLLLDNTVENPNALEICRSMKSSLEFSGVSILLVETHPKGAPPLEAIQAGCDDILSQPINPGSLLLKARSLLKIKNLMNDLDDSDGVLTTLARTIEIKDKYTMGHADRVSQFSVDLGKALGVNASEIETLRKGGMLHDVGKIAIPDAILTKPGRYTPEEFGIMKRHPLLGCNICKKFQTVNDAIPLIRHHHEKLDGSGYPDKLSGDQIPVLVRIVSIVDVYDALRSKRSYKEAFSVDKSFEIMWEEVEKGWWDKNVLTTWEKYIRNKS